MSASEDATSARITLPTWAWGGRPEGLFTAAALRSRRAGGGFLVRTNENYFGRRASLVDSAVVLDSAHRRGGGYPTLETLTDGKLEAPVMRSIARRFDLGGRPPASTLPTFVQRVQEDLAMCAGAELPEQCEDVLTALQAFEFDGGGQVFPMASVHWVRRQEALVHRVKLVSVLLRLERDERMKVGDVAALRALKESEEVIFAASSGLSDGVHLFDAYTGPLLACLSPAVWGFVVHRIHGSVIFSYGRPIAALANEQNELIRSLRIVSAESDEGGDRSFHPFGSGGVASSAISWWVDRLDEMFGVLTDPAVFADAEGDYEPMAALQAHLGVEQVFRRTNSLLIAYRDRDARRALSFTVLDTLRSLTGVSLDRMFDHTYAVQTLERLEKTLPAESKDLLLPSARIATAALGSVQEGFYLREPDGSVLINGRGAQPARAAASYLGMLRDATHGFTTTKANARQREEIATLLAVHDGHVHHDVALLAWLYLLDFLTQPERFRRIMRREASGARAG